MSDIFEEMIKAGEAFKEALGLSDGDAYELLKREKLEASEHDKKLRRKILSKYISDDEINKIEIEERVSGLKLLQQKLKNNMDKAVKIANKNTIRNEQGYVVLRKDDEWLNDTEYDEIIEK
jgi:hypothetical protein